MSQDPLSIEATPLRLRELVRRGVLPLPRLAEAVDVVSGPADPRRALRAVLLALGAALLVAGVAFFVAANWEALGRFARLGLVAAGVLVAVAVAVAAGPRSAGGRVALAVGGLLTGPALFLYGQTYQTGADAWQLFAGWLVLLLPFAIAARLAGVWWLALLLFHTTFVLALDQVWNLDPDDDGFSWFFCLLIAIDCACLFVAERVARRTHRRALPRGIAVILALTASGLGGLGVLDNAHGSWGNGPALAGAIVPAVWLVLTWRTDLLRAALGFFIGGVVFCCATGRLLFDGWHLKVGGVFLEGLVVLVYVGLASAWLRRQHKQGGLRAEDEP